jgi:ribosomal protein L34E
MARELDTLSGRRKMKRTPSGLETLAVRSDVNKAKDDPSARCVGCKSESSGQVER